MSIPLLLRRRRTPGWLSILIRDQELRCAHVVRDGDKATLQWVHHQVRDGHRSDPEELKRLRRRLKLQTYRCSTLIPRGSYQTFELPAPKVDRTEWRDALRWMVKDSLEFPSEQAMIEAMPIPNEGAPPGREPMSFVIAARRDVVANRVQSFQRAGIPLKVISIGNMAQRNAASMFETPRRGLAFLGIYALNAMLTFTCDGSIYATRHITYAPEDLLDSADAERRQVQIDRMVLAVQRAVDSFERQFSHVALPRLVFCAPPGHTELLGALRQSLSQAVEIADLRNVMDVSACPELENVDNQARWMLAVGLALRVEEGVA